MADSSNNGQSGSNKDGVFRINKIYKSSDERKYYRNFIELHKLRQRTYSKLNWWPKDLYLPEGLKHLRHDYNDNQCEDQRGPRPENVRQPQHLNTSHHENHKPSPHLNRRQQVDVCPDQQREEHKNRTYESQQLQRAALSQQRSETSPQPGQSSHRQRQQQELSQREDEQGAVNVTHGNGKSSRRNMFFKDATHRSKTERLSSTPCTTNYDESKTRLLEQPSGRDISSFTESPNGNTARVLDSSISRGGTSRGKTTKTPEASTPTSGKSRSNDEGSSKRDISSSRAPEPPGGKHIVCEVDSDPDVEWSWNGNESDSSFEDDTNYPSFHDMI